MRKPKMVHAAAWLLAALAAQACAPAQSYRRHVENPNDPAFEPAWTSCQQTAGYDWRPLGGGLEVLCSGRHNDGLAFTGASSADVSTFVRKFGSKLRLGGCDPRFGAVFTSSGQNDAFLAVKELPGERFDVAIMRRRAPLHGWQHCTVSDALVSAVEGGLLHARVEVPRAFRSGPEAAARALAAATAPSDFVGLLRQHAALVRLLAEACPTPGAALDDARGKVRRGSFWPCQECGPGRRCSAETLAAHARTLDALAALPDARTVEFDSPQVPAALEKLFATAGPEATVRRFLIAELEVPLERYVRGAPDLSGQFARLAAVNQRAIDSDLTIAVSRSVARSAQGALDAMVRETPPSKPWRRAGLALVLAPMNSGPVGEPATQALLATAIPRVETSWGEDLKLGAPWFLRRPAEGPVVRLELGPGEVTQWTGPSTRWVPVQKSYDVTRREKPAPLPPTERELQLSAELEALDGEIAMQRARLGWVDASDVVTKTEVSRDRTQVTSTYAPSAAMAWVHADANEKLAVLHGRRQRLADALAAARPPPPPPVVTTETRAYTVMEQRTEQVTLTRGTQLLTGVLPSGERRELRLVEDGGPVNVRQGRTADRVRTFALELRAQARQQQAQALGAQVTPDERAWVDFIVGRGKAPPEAAPFVVLRIPE